MAESRIFDWVCASLEDATQFSAIEARGTVRIALRKSGLDVSSVTPAQMQVVVKRVLPEELRRRGIQDGQPRCDAIATALHSENFAPDDDAPDSPETVFARIA
jgi:hypothetical protein